MNDVDNYWAAMSHLTGAVELALALLGLLILVTWRLRG